METINYRTLLEDNCPAIQKLILQQMSENTSKVIKNVCSKNGRLTLKDKSGNKEEKDQPCLYLWLASESAPKAILSNIKDDLHDEVSKFIEDSKFEFKGVTYYALYFGKSKNGTNRIINNHLNGTIRTSTLRRTLYGLCNGKTVKNENDIDKLFEGSCFQWLYIDKEEKEYLECLEAISIAFGHYLLNIDGNPAIKNKWRDYLTESRKTKKRISPHKKNR